MGYTGIFGSWFIAHKGALATEGPWSADVFEPCSLGLEFIFEGHRSRPLESGFTHFQEVFYHRSITAPNAKSIH
jgi:hypothetical protein